MPNQTNTQLSIIDELKLRLTDLKDSLKGNVTQSIFSELSASAKSIQDKINELLAKEGFLTQSDINDAYTVLQNTKRNELKKQSTIDAIRIGAYIFVGIAIFVAFYMYNKKRK